MEWIPILGKMDEIMPQVPPALAILSWGYPRFEGQLVFTKAFRDVRLAAAARSASGGHVLRKTEKSQWSPCSGLQSARPPLSCLGWGVTPTEDLNKLLVTSELSIFICTMEITLVPTLAPRLLTV